MLEVEKDLGIMRVDSCQIAPQKFNFNQKLNSF